MFLSSQNVKWLPLMPEWKSNSAARLQGLHGAAPACFPVLAFTALPSSPTCTPIPGTRLSSYNMVHCPQLCWAWPSLPHSQSGYHTENPSWRCLKSTIVGKPLSHPWSHWHQTCFSVALCYWFVSVAVAAVGGGSMCSAMELHSWSLSLYFICHIN